MDSVIQGQKGNGKSLYACNLIRDAYLMNIPIATNFDIFLDKFDADLNRKNVIRLPDFPTSQDLEIGLQNLVEKGVPENEMGMLFLDEVGKLWNSRSWAGDEDRAKMIGWLRESRKRGWKVFYIIQDIESLDAQFRTAMIEYVYTVKKMSRIKIPFVSMILNLFGFNFITDGILGRLHLVTECDSHLRRNGLPESFIADSGLYEMYETQQRFMRIESQRPCFMLSINYYKNQAGKKRLAQIKELDEKIKELAKFPEAQKILKDERDKVWSEKAAKFGGWIKEKKEEPGDKKPPYRVALHSIVTIEIETFPLTQKGTPSVKPVIVKETKLLPCYDNIVKVQPKDNTIPIWKRKDMRLSLFKMIVFPTVIFWSSIILKPEWSPEWARPYVDPHYNEADNYDLGHMFMYYPHRLIELTKEDFILAFKSGDKVATLTAKWFKEKKVPYKIDKEHGKLFVALKPFNNIEKYRELKLYDSSKEIALVKEEKPRTNVFLSK